MSLIINFAVFLGTTHQTGQLTTGKVVMSKEEKSKNRKEYKKTIDDITEFKKIKPGKPFGILRKREQKIKSLE